MSEADGHPAGERVNDAGDLAIVLHSHMPYVEGFGTYPFGEEWLFDAAIRSHLPILDFASDVTVTVTPVLADQLEAPGMAERLREFLVNHRIGAAANDIELAASEYRPAAEAELGRYQHALEVLDRHDGDILGAFADAQDSGRISLAASSATHAVLPLMASQRGIDLQVETGLRSHDRRFGWKGGFWLPECAYVPGLEWDLARSGVEWFCVDQSRYESGDDALMPVRTEAGPVAFTIDWPSISWLWNMEGYPSWPGYVDFHRLSMSGIRIFGIDGEPYDPEAAAENVSIQADQFIDDAVARLEGYRHRTGETGLMVYAVDTELLGHWWTEGPQWLKHVLERAENRGLNLVTLDEAAVGGTREAELKPSTWGEDKDFSTWDEPVVADLAWGARRLELEVARAVANGLDRDLAERAARELLAVQSSDWAFLDNRKQAGDYPYQRATLHAGRAYEALQSVPDEHLDSRVRSLAPDLSLIPLLAP
ncbi:MAG: 1,4-alpha-glucan branching protein domain-containing protein [Solirubrobacterales bacterium]